MSMLTTRSDILEMGAKLSENALTPVMSFPKKTNGKQTVNMKNKSGNVCNILMECRIAGTFTFEKKISIIDLLHPEQTFQISR